MAFRGNRRSSQAQLESESAASISKTPVSRANTVAVPSKNSNTSITGSMGEAAVVSKRQDTLSEGDLQKLRGSASLGRGDNENAVVSTAMDETFGMDWSQNAVNGCHMWGEREHARENCYVCGDGRTRGIFLKCYSCKVIVHEVCTDELATSGLQCRPTFREFTTSTCPDDFVHRHHWVNQRRPSGKCAGCGKAFKDKFPFSTASSREFIGVGCSWCKLLYHNHCFRFQLIDEPCTLGEFSSLILPPSCVVRVPKYDEPTKKRRSLKRRSRRSKEQRFFTIQPQKAAQKRPLLVFVNPKSGGNQGAKLMAKFIWLLNPRQVFNLLDGGPQLGLRLFARVQRVRVLICGGDGTVGWVLSAIDQLKIRPCPPIAILPIGTGNDLARTLYWGGGYQDESLLRILHQVDEAAVIHLDRWDLQLTPITNDAVAIGDEETAVVSEHLPLSVMNNYFSMGADALVVLDFHESREAKPERFSSRFFNKMYYATAGGKELLERKLRDLFKHVDVQADGIDLTPRIREGKVAALAFVNITRYSAGTQPWGVPGPDCEFGPSAPDDGRFEVLGFTTPMLATLHMGSHGIRLAQCREAIINTSRVIPVQVDGEPCRLAPSRIVISFRNQACMLQRVKRRERHPPPGSKFHTMADALPIEHRYPLSDQALIDGEFEVVHSSSAEGAPGLASGNVHLNASPYLPSKSRSANSSPLGTPPLSPSPDVMRRKRIARSNFTDYEPLSRSTASLPMDVLGAAEDPGHRRRRDDQYSNGAGLSVSSAGHRADLLGKGSLPVDAMPANGGQTYSTSFTMTQAASALAQSARTGGMRAFADPLTMPNPDDNGLGGSVSGSPGKVPLSARVSTDSDVFATDLQGALYNACRQGNLYGVVHALKLGASLLESDEEGLTALHHAARHNRKQIASHILRSVPREAIDAVDSIQQQTPLHKATCHGCPEVCQLLVDAGASLTVSDANGHTPYSLSKVDGDVELQKYLAACEQRQRIKEDPSETAV